VEESVHNISQVRNAGARAASAELLVFLDADTHVRPGIIQEILAAMADPNCFGGSVRVEYMPSERKWIRYYLLMSVVAGRFMNMHQGAAQFCRAAAFHEVGGYDTTIFIGEDVEFQWRLGKLAAAKGGSTVFIDEPKVLTSSRRFSKMGVLRTLVLTHPVTVFLLWRVGPVWKDWYENAVR
jgi:cellulose synthase/poly-beta-1,6-N-acetylglucosamine synthase-like glycosyltransferase